MCQSARGLASRTPISSVSLPFVADSPSVPGPAMPRTIRIEGEDVQKMRQAAASYETGRSVAPQVRPWQAGTRPYLWDWVRRSRIRSARR